MTENNVNNIYNNSSFPPFHKRPAVSMSALPCSCAAVSFLMCTENLFPVSDTSDSKQCKREDIQATTYDELPVTPVEELPDCPVTPPSTKCGPVSEIRRELRKYPLGSPYMCFSSKKLLSGDAPILEHIWIVGTLSVRHNSRFSASKRFPFPTSLQEALAAVQDMISESQSTEKNPKITGHVKTCEHARINNTRLDVAVKEAVSRYANEFPPLRHIYVFTLPDKLYEQVFLGRFS